MTDETDKSAEQEPDADSKGPRCGELLAEARREQQISIVEVAKELHLDEPKVRALERNEFDTLGAPVFAKGHLRKYSQLVGVNEDDVLTDYYQLTRQDALPPVVVARRRSRQEISPGPWIAVIVVIIVAAASYWWFAVFSAQSTTPISTLPAGPVEQQETGAAQLAPAQTSLPADMVDPEPEPESDPFVAESEPEPEPEPEQPALEDNEVLLSLTFTGDCWTEVSDAAGRRLFFRMGRSGTTIDLAGVPPFAVLFGDVDNVSVQIDGTDYPITNTSPGSRTARLTINNP